jgi:hypothetical protein
MKALSGVARLYILGMVVAGAEAAAWAAMNWSVPERQLVLAGALAVAASVALVLKVEGATRKSSYNLSLVVYALTVVLLGPAPAAAVVAISCLVDWAFHRYPWYIQAFNIASLLVGLTAAALAADAVTLLRVAPEVLSVARYVVLTAVFVLLNHLFVGIVIMLARGESLRESGVFDFMPLAMDASLFGLGTAGACIAAVNPWASLLVGPPLALLYFTLRIPQLERQAVTDAKTGLYNARHFNDALKRELEQAERYDRPLAVVMADLDLLRNINNRYGHVAGDIVLKGVADILSESVREYDIVGASAARSSRSSWARRACATRKRCSSASASLSRRPSSACRPTSSRSASR